MVPKFVRKQARDYQRTHPGVRYQQALDAVTAQLDDSDSAPGQLDVAQLLRIQIGVTEGGEVFEIDLKAESRGGTGPHGLCVGDPGTGKTEFLHTLVSNGCASHSPDDLNWVLAGWHSPRFKRLSGHPHVVSVIANGSELLDVVAAELDRRLRVLREAEAEDIWDYRSMREHNTEMAPLPTLIIVVDDFDVLVGDDRELHEIFRRVGRLGRTLGVQWLLAVQPSIYVLDRLPPTITYIVAFRMGATAARWVGVPPEDASDLRQPGSAILCAGATGKRVQRSASQAAARRPRRTCRAASRSRRRASWPPKLPAMPSTRRARVEMLSRGPTAQQVWSCQAMARTSVPWLTRRMCGPGTC